MDSFFLASHFASFSFYYLKNKRDNLTVTPNEAHDFVSTNPSLFHRLPSLSNSLDADIPCRLPPQGHSSEPSLPSFMPPALRNGFSPLHHCVLHLVACWSLLLWTQFSVCLWSCPTKRALPHTSLASGHLTKALIQMKPSKKTKKNPSMIILRWVLFSLLLANRVERKRGGQTDGGSRLCLRIKEFKN